MRMMKDTGMTDAKKGTENTAPNTGSDPAPSSPPSKRSIWAAHLKDSAANIPGIPDSDNALYGLATSIPGLAFWYHAANADTPADVAIGAACMGLIASMINAEGLPRVGLATAFAGAIAGLSGDPATILVAGTAGTLLAFNESDKVARKLYPAQGSAATDCCQAHSPLMHEKAQRAKKWIIAGALASGFATAAGCYIAKDRFESPEHLSPVRVDYPASAIQRVPFYGKKPAGPRSNDQIRAYVPVSVPFASV